MLCQPSRFCRTATDGKSRERNWKYSNSQREYEWPVYEVEFPTPQGRYIVMSKWGWFELMAFVLLGGGSLAAFTYRLWHV